MRSTTSNVSLRQDTYWWKGSVMEGQIGHRVADDESVAGPRTEVRQTRGVMHTFRVESEGARALAVFTPGGPERMFEEGRVPARESAEPSAGVRLAGRGRVRRHGFEIVGPQLA